MPRVTLPPVNRDSDPLLCPHGVYATFEGPEGEIELSLLCELMVGHSGPHWADGAGVWYEGDMTKGDPWPEKK